MRNSGDFCVQSLDAVTVEHVALHLPKTAGCGACEWRQRARKIKSAENMTLFSVDWTRCCGELVQSTLAHRPVGDEK